MVHTILYANKDAFNGTIATNRLNEYLCDDVYEPMTSCVDTGSQIDHESGHRVCSGCRKTLRSSGLRRCDICNSEYVNLNKYQNPRFETNCPDCIERFGIEE